MTIKTTTPTIFARTVDADATTSTAEAAFVVAQRVAQAITEPADLLRFLYTAERGGQHRVYETDICWKGVSEALSSVFHWVEPPKSELTGKIPPYKMHVEQCLAAFRAQMSDVMVDGVDQTTMPPPPLAEMKALLEARDTLVVWQALHEASTPPGTPLPFAKPTTYGDLRATAAEYDAQFLEYSRQVWTTINLSEKRLTSIPDALTKKIVSGDGGSTFRLNIQQLYLMNNYIRDLSGIEGLTALQILSLNGNPIVDITPLAGLPHLTTLSLNKSEVSDLSSIEEMPQLNVLYMRENRIKDIRPLSRLPQLQFVSLNNNRISDISPLGNLAHLESLSLGGNQIKDISPLLDLPKLSYVVLENNEIDIATLGEKVFVKGRGARPVRLGWQRVTQ